MKKLLLLLLFVPLVSFGQIKVDVEVREKQKLGVQTDFGQIARDNLNSYRESREARQRVLANQSTPETKIIAPLSRDFSEFTHIALVSSRLGYRKPRDNYMVLKYNYMGKPPFNIIDPYENDKKKFKYNNNYLSEIKNPKWLYLTFRKLKQGFDWVTTLTIKDYENNILYKSSSINTPSEEVLSILSDFQNVEIVKKDEVEIKKDILSKEKAINEVKQLKELLDSGILTQEEYNKKASVLKKIILGN